MAGAAAGDTESISSPLPEATFSLYTLPDTVSADGRYVAFYSGRQIVLHDRITQTNESFVAGAYRGGISISTDGRFIAFVTGEAGLIPEDRNQIYDVFVRDRQTGLVELISVNSSGEQANDFSYQVSISGDGRYVVFSSFATNLTAAGGNHQVRAIYLRDRLRHVTTRVSADDNTASHCCAAISDDGRYVTFATFPDPVGGLAKALVRDLQTGLLEEASVNSDGVPSNGISVPWSLSADGRYVAFVSYGSNLVPGDTNVTSAIFVRDRVSGQTERVNVAYDGSPGNYSSSKPVLSGDGRFVAYESLADNLVPNDTNRATDIFVRDRWLGTTRRVSVGSNGDQATVKSIEPGISTDGRFVVFASRAPLVPNDLNRNFDIFIHELDSAPDFRFTLKPAALDFGNQALYTATSLSFWLRNKGDVPLPVTSVAMAGLNRAMWAVDNRCGNVVAVAAVCGIRVTFRPTSSGAEPAQLQIIAGDKDLRTRAVTGTGVISTFSVAPTSLSFGSVPMNTTSPKMFVTVKNTGGVVLPIESIALAGSNAASFSMTHDCPPDLTASSACTISVVFKPTWKGSASALLNITPRGGAATRSVALKGAGS